MHIYSLQVGEWIRIGHVATASVVGIKGGQVRLGISAPSDIPIYREELVECSETESGLETNHRHATEIDAGPEGGPQDPAGPETQRPGIS